jgi:hypothetical protein
MVSPLPSPPPSSPACEMGIHRPDPAGSWPAVKSIRSGLALGSQSIDNDTAGHTRAHQGSPSAKGREACFMSGPVMVPISAWRSPPHSSIRAKTCFRIAQLVLGRTWTLSNQYASWCMRMRHGPCVGYPHRQPTQPHGRSSIFAVDVTLLPTPSTY